LEPPITDIIKYLETKDDALKSMIGSFAACNTPFQADELIKEIKCKADEYASDFRAAGNVPFCNIFLAAADVIKGHHSQALKHLEDAERGFNCSGQVWNLAMATWMHALIGQGINQPDRADRAFKKASAILTRLSFERRRNGLYEDADECLRLARQIDDTASLKPEPVKTGEGPVSSVSPAEPVQPRSASIAFPVYDPVHAGESGNFIFDSQPQGQASINELIIDDEPFRVFSLKAGEPVVLQPRVYRWLYVVGDSMNQASPQPLIEGDCILVVETGTAGLSPKVNDIVVAALVDPAGAEDRAGVVKRYTKTGLCSESKQSYSPIPLKKAKVKGIVLAVAKPIKRNN
jgi:hypothetical protein